MIMFAHQQATVEPFFFSPSRFASCRMRSLIARRALSRNTGRAQRASNQSNHIPLLIHMHRGCHLLPARSSLPLDLGGLLSDSETSICPLATAPLALASEKPRVVTQKENKKKQGVKNVRSASFGSGVLLCACPQSASKQSDRLPGPRG